MGLADVSKLSKTAVLFTAFSSLCLPSVDKSSLIAAEPANTNLLNETNIDENIKRQLALKIITFEDIPTSALKSPTLIVTLLKDQETRAKILNMLQAEDFSSPEVSKTFIELLPEIYGQKNSPIKSAEWFSNKELKSAFKQSYSEASDFNSYAIRTLFRNGLIQAQVAELASNEALEVIATEPAKLEMIDITSPQDPAYFNKISAQHIGLTQLSDKTTCSVNQLIEDKISIAESLDKGDLKILLNIAPEILDTPYLHFKARSAINNSLHLRWRDTRLNNGTKQPYTDGLSSEEVAKIVELHAKRLPDVAHLIYNPIRAYKISYPLLLELASYNPRFAHTFPTISNTVPKGFYREVERISQAFETIGITNFHRFDNGREILRNRYLISNEETKQRLVELLGMKYFEGVEKSNKPTVVFTICMGDSDLETAFAASETHFEDYIDCLTSQYQLVYHETKQDHEAIGSIINTSRNLGVKIPYQFIAGHGNQFGATLGVYKKDKGLNNGRLDVGDTEITKEAGPHLADGAKVFLICCDAAFKASPEEICFGEAIHNTWPHTEVICPDGTTNFTLTFTPNGEIKEIQFGRANRITYKPSGERRSDFTEWDSPVYDRYRIRQQDVVEGIDEGNVRYSLVKTSGAVIAGGGISIFGGLALRKRWSKHKQNLSNT